MLISPPVSFLSTTRVGWEYKSTRLGGLTKTSVRVLPILLTCCLVQVDARTSCPDGGYRASFSLDAADWRADTEMRVAGGRRVAAVEFWDL
jgi:major membrane immunogen (membrane-anchored lipoprotein)